MRPFAEVTGVGGAFWLAVAAERLWYPVRCGTHAVPGATADKTRLVPEVPSWD